MVSPRLHADETRNRGALNTDTSCLTAYRKMYGFQPGSSLEGLAI